MTGRRSRRTIVCPCHDATLEDLEKSWAAGFRDPETIKRATSVFMGPCQGKYCAAVVERVLDELGGVSPATAPAPALRPSVRPPLYPVRLGQLADPGSGHAGPER
jgi:hypothetical protein